VARILLIDDDPSLLDALTLAFEDAGHEVLVAPDGVSGAELVRREKPALLVSDINMPGLDGFALCKKIRAEGSAIPIILLSSRDGEIDESLGLELGADDYVSKPFSTRVLLARVAALLRRTEARAAPATPESEKLEVGRLSLSLDRLELHFSGVRVEVAVREFRVLECLARNRGEVVSRKRLLEQLRGDTTEGRLVDTYVKRLRRKLEAIDATEPVIETVVGEGYRLREGG
jgi:DNA-binding response OmpR family regulator